MRLVHGCMNYKADIDQKCVVSVEINYRIQCDRIKTSV